MEMIKQYENKELGIMVAIFKKSTGYQVQTKDTDADMWLPYAVTYPDFDKANDVAKKNANV